MRRLIMLIAIVTVAAGATAVWAVAAQQAGGPPTITGCLKHDGNLARFAVGNAPIQTCDKNDTQVSLSSGDITSIATPLAGGLAGGTDSGDATLSLQQRFQLPQTCNAGDVIRYSAALQYWTCGSALESQAYEVYRMSVPFTVSAVGQPGQKVLTLHLPPGTYSLASTVNSHQDSGSGQLVCVTYSQPGRVGNTLTVQSVGVFQGASQFSSGTGTGTGTVANGGTFELWCWRAASSPDPGPTILNASITAVSIAKTTVSEDTSSSGQYGG
jgi:hypothetical protein